MSKNVPESLSKFFQTHRRVAIAFSGGCDSSYLLYAARMCDVEFRAYTVETAFRSPVERKESKEVCDLLGVYPTIIDADPLRYPEITANGEDRCYLCKKLIFNSIQRRARLDGFQDVCDATNDTDDPTERPGMRALTELGVLSPLKEAGLDKAYIRLLSRDAGLPTWDSPSDSCLATRISAGVPITEESLRRTYDAETSLHKMGFKGIRARTLPDGTCRLEILDNQADFLKEHEGEVSDFLKGLYPSYTVSTRKAR